MLKKNKINDNQRNNNYKDNDGKKKNKLMLIFLLLIITGVIVLLALDQYLYDYQEKTTQHKEKTIDITELELTQNYGRELSNNHKKKLPDEIIKNLCPYSKIYNNNILYSKNFEFIKENNLTKSLPENDNKKEKALKNKGTVNFKDYKNYLFATSNLLVKLAKEQPYSQELKIISKLEFPSNINDIIDILFKFNYLIELNNKPKNIIPFGSKTIGKFITITYNPITLEYNQMKSLLYNNIDQLINYIYSYEIKKQFIK